MTKVDFKKELKHLYNPPAREVVIVDVPTMNYLMVDGQGDANTSPAYMNAIAVLYGLSYTLKFMVKKSEAAIDYVVMPLESLWWVDETTRFVLESMDFRKWTAMIMQPMFVTRELFEKALDEVGKKRSPPDLSKVRFESLHEGLSAQILHIGPYFAEGPTIAKVLKFIEENGHELRGKHHEIYLNDPHRTTPGRIKTVLRLPFEAAQSSPGG